MRKIAQARSFRMAVLGTLVAAWSLLAATSFAENHTTKPFAGNTVNGGTVTLSKQGNRTVLTLSDDFKVPGSPDPHWQLVDSKGNVFLVQKLMIKPDKFVKSITVPEYVHDVAKVQIWCAFAETVLGEASFSSPVK